MVWVDTTGHVKKAEIYKSTLPPIFEARALDAAARWVFVPIPIDYRGRRWVVQVVITFPLSRFSEGPDNSVNTDLDLTVHGKPVSVGDKLEAITTVKVRSPAGMRIVINFPGWIILTGTERLHEVLDHQGGKLVLTERGLEWMGTVEPTQPLVLRRRFFLASCHGDSVVVTQEPGQAACFVCATKRAAVILKCR
jgi:TonB family protein